jgi:hypothetical protein
MAMHRITRLVPLALTLALSVPGCGGGDAKDSKADKKAKGDKKAETKAELRDPGTSLDEVAKGADLSGPVPPDISAVFFAVDGALIPLACFNKDKGKLMSGKDCGPLVEKGGEVYLRSADATETDTIGEPKNALCEAGAAGKPRSFATAKLDGGQAYDFAVFPKSAAQKVIEVSVEDTTAGARTSKISDADKKALQEAILKLKKRATGEVNIHQLAALDVDGDSAPDTFYSAFVVNPKDTARFLFSGLFMRSSKNERALVLIDQTKTNLEVYTLRGAIDLDGDGTHELWVNAAFNEGGGDRLVQIKGDAVKPIGKYSCGL